MPTRTVTTVRRASARRADATPIAAAPVEASPPPAVEAAKAPKARRTAARAAQPAAAAPAPAKRAKPAKAPKPPKPAKAPKEPKAERGASKPVRDSFTMPASDFGLIAVLKSRALSAQRAAKKSELLRAGLHALAALDAAELVQALNALEPVPLGRPKQRR